MNTLKKLLHRFHYNAPVTLTFALVCLCALALGSITDMNSTRRLFMTYRAPLTDPLMYFRLVGHAIGHAGWSHYLSNMLYILMLGPMLEEKYGSKMILEMMVITAVITGILFNLIFPDSALLGASGIVFMFIILSSVTNAEKGRIPITFIVICILYLGNEFVNAFREDNISQLGHIIGGACGGFFGLFLVHTGGIKKDSESTPEPEGYTPL
jgi:membrane associated rhomboid family serine protease